MSIPYSSGIYYYHNINGSVSGDLTNRNYVTINDNGFTFTPYINDLCNRKLTYTVAGLIE